MKGNSFIKTHDKTYLLVDKFNDLWFAFNSDLKLMKVIEITTYTETAINGQEKYEQRERYINKDFIVEIGELK